MPKSFERPERCFGCGACAFRCPKDALRMETDAEGFRVPVFDPARCIACGHCADVCPAKHDPGTAEVTFHALRAGEEAVLSESTSGGAFSLIAEQVIKNGGLAAGAVFDGAFHIRHVLADDIRPMRKSKYAESAADSCFGEIEEALRRGRTVLFSGTPCQCHAVKLLFPEAEGLLLCALVCRGVASPLLFSEYLRYLGEKKGEIRAFCFRDKRRGDDARCVSYTAGEEEHLLPFMDDPFCRIYAKGLAFRKSCHTCPYTRPDKPFDFTIGDFWGVEEVFPDLHDGRGVSLVITTGKRAEAILDALGDKAEIRKTAAQPALQEALRAPLKESLLRRFLFRDLAAKGPDGHCDMELIIRKYGF